VYEFILDTEVSVTPAAPQLAEGKGCVAYKLSGGSRRNGYGLPYT
jgi:hypothetical protein